ncbi:MAG: ceramidase domain-containing protein [Rhodobacteraceae bacterium]|nr:ceramidase domain-containing protein [Paracoccaceae bacterium]
MNNYIDGYCERLEPGLWAEPLNALTNAAFIIAAIVMFIRPGVRNHAVTMILCFWLFAIGVGSGLFHTFATGLTALADVLSIALFVLTYLYASNRYYWGLKLLPAAGLTVLFFPYAALMGFILDRTMPWLGGSAAYCPIIILIFAYAFLLRNRLPRVARDLAIGAAILSVSLAFRWLDEPICDAFPYGTHYVWHVLNAVMLAWMIRALEAHLAENPGGDEEVRAKNGN